MKYKLSIIVPTYNTGNYLDECINSIIKQDYNNIELIIIDDGSTEIEIDNVIKKYSNIKELFVIHQNNKGVSCARNIGINIASGEYIGFVDADDYVSTNMYRKLMNIVSENKCDVVACGISYINEEGKIFGSDKIKKGKYNTNDYILKALYSSPIPFAGTCCNKIYKVSLFKNVYFDENVRFAEDWLLLCNLLLNANSLVSIEDKMYFIRRRHNSVTRVNLVDAMSRLICDGRYLSLKLLPNMKKDIQSYAVVKYLDDSARYCKEIRKLFISKRLKNKNILEIKKKWMFVLIKSFRHRYISFKEIMKNIYLLLII